MIKLRCKKCKGETEYREGIPAFLGCQKCGGDILELRTTEDIKLECLACHKVEEVKAGRVFPLKHNCREAKGFWIINPGVVENVKKPDKSKYLDTDLVKEEEVEEREEKDTVSVVVVCHNQFSVTKECIKRIRLLDPKPEKIILVDNNSTDKTSKWAKEQEDVIYVQNKMNFGCVIARNQGVKYCDTKWILFLDNDQYVPSNLIYRELQEGGDVVGIEHWRIDKEGTPRPVDSRSMRVTDYVGAGGLLVKKEVFDSVGGFDERYAPAYYEDPDFCFRVRKKGFEINYLQKSKVEHLAHKTIDTQKDFDKDDMRRKSRSLFMSIWDGFLRNPAEYVTKEIEEKKEEEEKELKGTEKQRRERSKKPKIYIAVDTRGWAWDFKTQEIVHYLRDDFEFVVDYASEGGLHPPEDAALYFTYELNWVDKLKFVPDSKKVTGVTAHTYTNFDRWKDKLERVKAIHANSMMLYEEIEKINKSYYVPNGVNEKIFDFRKPSGSKKKKFTVGYVGKDTERKGYRGFVKKACDKAGVRLLTAVGKVSDAKYSHTEMPGFYEKIDCIMIASDMDGTPNQLLEAAAVGRTFIANRIGNVSEFYNGDNGIIVERKVDEYVKAIKYLQEHRRKCAKMGMEARTEIERNWTWKDQVENYRKMFWDLI